MRALLAAILFASALDTVNASSENPRTKQELEQFYGAEYPRVSEAQKEKPVIFAPAIMRSVDRNRATSAPQSSATASPSLGDAIQIIVKQRITDALQKNLLGKSNAPTPEVVPSPSDQPTSPPPP